MATVTEVAPTQSQAEFEPEGPYEVVDGQVVEKPAMGAYEGEIACLLMEPMLVHVRAKALGRVVSEILFRIDAQRKLNRRPDVAFVSHERWPIGRRAPRTAAWDVVPDLAVEVLSPSNRSVDDLGKVDEYFRAGVRLVWVVYPTLDKVLVHESPTSIRVLTRGDTLDGGEVVPGFSLPLAELFGDEIAWDLCAGPSRSGKIVSADGVE